MIVILMVLSMVLLMVPWKNSTLSRDFSNHLCAQLTSFSLKSQNLERVQNSSVRSQTTSNDVNTPNVIPVHDQCTPCDVNQEYSSPARTTSTATKNNFEFLTPTKTTYCSSTPRLSSIQPSSSLPLLDLLYPVHSSFGDDIANTTMASMILSFLLM